MRLKQFNYKTETALNKVKSVRIINESFTRKRERLFGRSLFLCLRLEPVAAEGGVERVSAPNYIIKDF